MAWLTYFTFYGKDLQVLISVHFLCVARKRKLCYKIYKIRYFHHLCCICCQDFWDSSEYFGNKLILFPCCSIPFCILWLLSRVVLLFNELYSIFWQKLEIKPKAYIYAKQVTFSSVGFCFGQNLAWFSYKLQFHIL